MAEPLDVDAVYEVGCPHCGKAFEGPLLSAGSRYQGFKCPHCRLFVSLERVEEPARVEPRTTPARGS